MREEIAAFVFPVLRAGIEIKEGLRADPGDYQFAECRTRLLGLLQEPVRPDLRDEIWGDVPTAAMIRSSDAMVRLDIFLGLRYALACWLDEIFIRDSSWRTIWNENKLETTLFRTTLRAEKFWDQAQRARSRTTRDALEVYYLCVMLGFRGELLGKSLELQSWREEAETQIINGDGRAYSPPPGIKIVPNVHVLHGYEQMARWLFLATAVGLAYIPVIIILFGS